MIFIAGLLAGAGIGFLAAMALFHYYVNQPDKTSVEIKIGPVSEQPIQ